MNPAARKTTAVIGLTAIGIFIADRMTRSKNNTVHWGITEQLDQMNEVADSGKDLSESANHNPLRDEGRKDIP